MKTAFNKALGEALAAIAALAQEAKLKGAEPGSDHHTRIKAAYLLLLDLVPDV